jgi:hypothetical protein
MKTISELDKQNRQATALAGVWDKWFPSLAGQAPVEYWMVMLDDFHINVLGEAIRRCAKQRVKTPMTLPDMQTFIAQAAPAIAEGSPR